MFSCMSGTSQEFERNAREVARSEGKTGKALEKRTDELVRKQYNTIATDSLSLAVLSGKGGVIGAAVGGPVGAVVGVVVGAGLGVLKAALK